MEMKEFALILSFFLFVFSACEPDSQDDCNINRNTPNNILEEELEIGFECLAEEDERETYFIKTQEEFEMLFSDDCTTLPSVDFDEFDVLSLSSGASGCFQDYQAYVRKDGIDYDCIIRVKECGGCEPWVVRRHWLVVPNIPEVNNINFIIERL